MMADRHRSSSDQILRGHEFPNLGLSQCPSHPPDSEQVYGASLAAKPEVLNFDAGPVLCAIQERRDWEP